ncbi:MAG: PLP-dependent aminotransferase family protein [Anaerolineales bacterium]|nr:PLP-dependent aminotransferase family protein [Anaerolineales bacterium]
MSIFASRMNQVHKSFIREILKVTADPEVISFAGGLPNANFFPVDEIAAAASKVLAADGVTVLQYATSEGHRPLREWIAQRYEADGVHVDPDEILITNGSQQGLDLIGKVLLNEGDTAIIEKPGYLGAIQTFSLYGVNFAPVDLLNDGLDVEQLQQLLQNQTAKLFYSVPNFQNPSGVSYTAETRAAVAELLQQHNVILVEDDPYGALRFTGQHQPLIRHYHQGTSITLGSFSKIVSPGLRMGWIAAPRPIMDKLLIAKQASDLHSNYFTQRILFQYLQDNPLDEHIGRIRAFYGQQCEQMLELLAEHMPAGVTYTRPEGGMFVWVTLPQEITALDLFDRVAAQKVVFVPGPAFYTDGTGAHTLRLNFSNADPDRMAEGIGRLGQVVKEMMAVKEVA